MIRVDEYKFSRRKTLAVCIDVFGRVIVRAPKGCPQKRIEAFLQSKEAWIVRHKREKEGNASLLPMQIDGYKLPYLGGELLLCVGEAKRTKREGDRLLLPAENAEAALVSWLKKQARELLFLRTMYWQEKMGVRCKDVKISSARRKWGSCSGKDEIRYAYRLLFVPKDLLDYVVVHELAHIRHKNHSPAFWAEVKKYMPDCFLRRKNLQRFAVYLEFF